MKMTGNTIFITGSTSGIGRGLAEAFHKLGNKVIIAGRRKALLDEVTAANPGMESISFDVTDLASIEAAARELISRFPTLNVLINNAGIMPFDDASGAIDDSVTQSILTTNLLGPIRMTSALIEQLKSQPESVIINNTSVLAYVPLAGNAVYSASKAALHSYTLSQRFMLRDTSVRVQEIAPPWVDTDLIHKAGDPRAMPLDAFIAETMEKLATDDPEIVVDAIKAIRDNPGANEHALIHGFNLSLIENPIPVGA
ncbi:putative oxidoreductase [Sphingomonas oligoaromativorans]|nr:putative oxidoreductase [Sphingomonas oligoaromativorans]